MIIFNESRRTYTFIILQSRSNANSMLNTTFEESGCTSKEWQMTADDLENDDSPSEPLEVTLPRHHDGELEANSN